VSSVITQSGVVTINSSMTFKQIADALSLAAQQGPAQTKEPPVVEPKNK
jgi:hypothetical protein